MEAETLSEILLQASKLHDKFDDSIDKVRLLDDKRNEEKSLSAVRDALEVLEEQLDCLQLLQQQQEADREAALLELEESRRIFLERLRNYKGSEGEVIEEALAFAGEPVSLCHKVDDSMDLIKEKERNAKMMRISSVNKEPQLLEWKEMTTAKENQLQDKEAVIDGGSANISKGCGRGIFSHTIFRTCVVVIAVFGVMAFGSRTTSSLKMTKTQNTCTHKSKDHNEHST